MHPLDWMRLTGLVARLARRPSAGADPRVEERVDQKTAAGAPYDVYSPSRRPVRARLVALHGVTMAGGRDKRLVHLSRCLARAGVAVVVPSLRGMSALRVTPTDIDDLCDIVTDAAAWDDRPLGMMAFSWGASYALCCAARPDVAEHVRFVISLGAYHHLGDLLDSYAGSSSPDSPEPRTEIEWEEGIYLRLVAAYREPTAAGLDAAMHARAADLLQRYCHAATREEKRAFYDQHLRDMALRRGFPTDPALLDQMSPAGRLAGLKCPVSLIHDVNDAIVPVEHADRLHAELEEHPLRDRHRHVRTTVLTHVALQNAFKVGEMLRLLRAVGPIVSDL